MRELENLTMNLLLFDRDGGRISAELVRRLLGQAAAPPAAGAGGEAGARAAPAGEAGQAAVEGALRERLAAFERRLVEDALQRMEGNKAAAARDLGVSVRTLYKMLDRLGLGDSGRAG